MPIVSGTPDWQGAFGTDEFTFLPAYGRNDYYYAIPRITRLPRRSGGGPDFLLEFVSDRNRAGVEDSLYASLNMGLTREPADDRAYRFLAQRAPAAGMAAAAFAPDTCWRLQSGETRMTQLFAWEDAERARIFQRIPMDLAKLIYGALDRGSASVIRSAIEAGLPSVLPRIETTVTFETAALLKALCALNPGGQSVAFRKMTTFFGEQHPEVLKFEGSDSGDAQRSRALALAGRVAHFLGKPAPCPRIDDGPFVALPPLDDLSSGYRWDLRTPLLMNVPLFLDFDPFTAIVEKGARESVVQFVPIPPLPHDRLTERVTIDPNLPANIATHDSIELTLRVLPELSHDGLLHRMPLTLAPSDGKFPPVELKFKRSEPKTYGFKIRAESENEPLDTEWSEHTGNYLYIGPESLPGTAVSVRASDGLLSQAAISIKVTGGAETYAASLSESQPAATFLLGDGYADARLAIVACDLTDSRRILTLDLPARPVSLGLPAFPQYGPQTVFVTVRFEIGIPAADFEFLPEGEAGSPIRLSFTPSAASLQFGYFAGNLFRRAYRYRRFTDDDAPWSEYQSPEEPLTIYVTEKES